MTKCFSSMTKIGIISDSHENLQNLQQSIDYLNKNKIKTLIHCGDVARFNMLEEIDRRFDGITFLVWGNADEGFFKDIEYAEYKNIKFCKQAGKIEIEGKKIAITHFPKIARKLASSGKHDLVFYGHTHKPWEEKIGQTKMLNPGNLDGSSYRASFAVYDLNSDIAELKILDEM